MVATILCIGMAGSGKTTFVQQLCVYLHKNNTTPYTVNLDPAVAQTSTQWNIDIRDSVNYSKVRKDYDLGPNGAITTSLNLFSTKIDQVMSILDKRASTVDHIIIDTPGQIECFIWSASGQIITESLASSLPTMIAYIVDTPRSSSPATFMSNMLYACSILYKTKLPMIIVFNKTDAKDSAFAHKWMTDFEAFQNSLRLDDEQDGPGYMGSLMSSLSLVLEEFYNTLDVCSVSALTGEGMDTFLKAVSHKVKEYQDEYVPERERLRKLRSDKEADRRAQELSRLIQDVGLEKATAVDVLSDDDSDQEPGTGN